MNFKSVIKNTTAIGLLVFIAFSVTKVTLFTTKPEPVGSGFTLECPTTEQQLLHFGPHADRETNLPPHFRTTQDVDKLKFDAESNELMQGLAQVNASGSAQFYEEVIPTMINTFREKAAHDITIVDVREESHVFINGVPYFWYLRPNDHFNYARYNINKPVDDIEKDEAQKITDLIAKKKIHVFGLKPTAHEHKGWPDVIDCEDQSTFDIETISTEKDLVKKHGLHYVRMPITDDHGPRPDVVDSFIQYFKNHKDTWYHVHCEAGHGRTTAVIALIDMLYNAKTVPFEIIIKRQFLLGQGSGLGGANLFETKNTNHLLEESQKKRLEILKSLYQYCKENTDNYATPYSVWLKNQAPHNKSLPKERDEKETPVEPTPQAA